MSGLLMPVIRTPISTKDFARAVIRVLRETSETLTKEACGVLWSQYALETGAGEFCWNYNLFNHKVTQQMVAAGVPYMMLAGTWEIENGKRVIYQPPHPATWFRSYSGFEAAMSHHLAAVRTGRYASSWPFIAAGDVSGYAAALRSKGYYTASVEAYTALLASKHAMWMRSPAYENALAEFEEANEAETDPEIHLPDFPIVHSLRLVQGDPPEEPDDAA